MTPATVAVVGAGIGCLTLAAALASVLVGNVLHLGRRLLRLEERADQVLLRFEDGSTHAADVVVGADGIHSVVRETLVADRPVFSGQTIYRGLVPGDRLPELVR